MKEKLAHECCVSLKHIYDVIPSSINVTIKCNYCTGQMRLSSSEEISDKEEQG